MIRQGAPGHCAARLGIVLQELAIEPNLTVREVLTRNTGYYLAPRPVDEVIALGGLEGKASSRIARLLGGEQRRLDVGLPATDVGRR